MAGGVRCWGGNHFGQLGDGTTDDRPMPAASDVLGGVEAIAVGDYHTCALLMTGGVRCWGSNQDGQLGDTAVATGYLATSRSPTPSKTDVLSDVQAIAAGSAHTCALMKTGGVRCWGGGVATPPTTDWLSDVQAIASDGNNACALMTTSAVRCWREPGMSAAATPPPPIARRRPTYSATFRPSPWATFTPVH